MTLNQRDDRTLVCEAPASFLGELPTASGRGAHLLAFDAAKIGLVGFDDLPRAAHRRKIEAAFAHCLHHTMMQEPCGIVLAAKLAMQLMRGDPLLRRGGHCECHSPLCELGVAAFHDGA